MNSIINKSPVRGCYVICIKITADDPLFLVIRKRGSKYFTWPGGKRDGDRNDEKAVQRETVEEAGIFLTLSQLKRIPPFTGSIQTRRDGDNAVMRPFGGQTVYMVIDSKFKKQEPEERDMEIVEKRWLYLSDLEEKLSPMAMRDLGEYVWKGPLHKILIESGLEEKQIEAMIHMCNSQLGVNV